MSAHLIQDIATYPVELLISFMMMLFGMSIHHIDYGWRVMIVGFVAFVFWLHVFKFLLTLIKRKFFGIYE